MLDPSCATAPPLGPLKSDPSAPADRSSVNGGDGIYMDSNNTATIGNYGDISVVPNSSGDYGIDVSAYDAINVTNGGSIEVAANKYTAVGIDADSWQGDVDVENTADGSIEASSTWKYSAGVTAWLAWADEYVDAMDPLRDKARIAKVVEPA